RLTAVTFMGNAFEKEDINIQRHIRMLVDGTMPSEGNGTNIVLKKLVTIARQASLMKDLSSEER
ncbi:hypothetical protein STEG23_025069, partial [Scotinomys teguina]